MKISLRMALASLIVVGCVVTWALAQQATPPATPSVAAPPSGFAPGAGGGFPQGPAVNSDDGLQTVIEVTPDGGKVLRTLRGGKSPGGYGVSNAVNAYFSPDPDMAKLFAAEEEAAREAQAATAELRSTKEEKEKAAGGIKLREALAKQFDAQQKRRALEIGKIEERLGKLKDTMKKRETAKETIIGRRFDELTGVTDELGWEETGIGARIRTGEGSLYTVPANVPGAYPPPTPAPPRAR